MKRISTLLLLSATIGVAHAQTPLNLYGREASGTVGVVAAARPEAAQVGVSILKKGGNAVDAAVATAFMLGVVEPANSGLGGGGFMLVKLANQKEPVVVDFREVAPAASTPDMFQFGSDGKVVNEANAVGGLASGVPGEVAGLLYALEKFGSKKVSRTDVIQPAINTARNGVPVTANFSSYITAELKKINKFPAAAKIYTNGGLPLEVGDTLKNPELAATLELVAKQGRDGFYKGDIAKKIVAASQETGGIITEADLAAYQPKIRKPVSGTYRGYTVTSLPPPSSGGTHIIQILNILENFDMAKMGIGTPATLHVWSEALRLAFADRAKYMADTDFVKNVPLSGLASKEYAKELTGLIDMQKPMATVEAGNPFKYESGSTTSFSVMDKHGNMVTVTKSINYLFGSGVVVPGAGFMMNNHMDDFVLKPGSVNSIEPGKRPLSSMSPTIVLDPKGRPFMTLGSPGATRIIPAVAEVISNVVDHGMPIQEAIAAPRYYRMHTGDYNFEGRVSINTKNALETMGHKVLVKGDWDMYFGGVHAVLYDHKKHILIGGADPRRDGQAAAY